MLFRLMPFVFVLAFAVLVGSAQAVTIHIDDNAPNDPGHGDPTVSDPAEDGSAEHPFDAIQEGIDAAQGGDEVVVADGTYTGDGNKELDFDGRAITVRSENGAETCIIDCEDSGRGFYFHTDEDVDLVVAGFTIRNGSAATGGGIYCFRSSPTITNCTISGNSASNNGGGVYCGGSSSSPTIANCVISGNSANYGGGVYRRDSSSLTIENCTITGNDSDYHGGGIYCESGSTAITNCTITENIADGHGGGVYCESGDQTITNCILWGDAPEEIYIDSGSPIVTYCDVQGYWDGEGNIDIDPGFAFGGDRHLVLDSPCIDAGSNTPPGGLPAEDLDGNPRPLDGDGDESAVADMGAFEFNPDISWIALSPIELTFYGPRGGNNPDPQALFIRNCGGATLNWQVVEDCSWLSVLPTGGEADHEVDEVAVSVDTSGMAYGIYDCVLEVVDEGTANSLGRVTVTLYVSETLHVPSEYETIQAGIDAAVDGDIVLVADGRYTGGDNRDLNFGGKAIVVRSENGAEACIIDCEFSGCGFYFHNDEDASSVVDGFTIRNGQPSGNGGGICCWGSSPTITNCTIRHNSTPYDGGGLYCAYESSPTITNCTISGNSADSNGGGAYCGGYSSPAITSCTISGNYADSSGGGAYCSGYSSPVFTSCTISGNSASSGGGGVLCGGYSSRAITNCTISGNSAEVGGGVYCSSGTTTITNCTISGNSATGLEYGLGRGGGIYCESGSTTITNCTITGNSADPGWGHGDGVYSNGSSLTITNCILWGDTPQEINGSYSTTVTYCDVQGGWDGEGNIDNDPLFFNPLGDDGIAGTADDDLHFEADSPCIDMGDPGVVLTPGETDRDGHARVLRDRVDMGAYEFGIGDYDRDYVLDLADFPGCFSCATGPEGEPYAEDCEACDFDFDLDVDLFDFASFQVAFATSTVSAQRTLYVNGTTGDDAWDGQCEEWDGGTRGPKATIQAGIDMAVDSDTILVADGTYTGEGNKNLDYGGKAITVRSANGPEACVIDCEGSGRGFHFHRDEGADSVLDGFTVRNGRVDHDVSGGIYCYSSSPTITNCTISENYAEDRGGGIGCFSYSCPTISDCTISGNSVSNRGAGIYCRNSSNATIINCTISGNSAPLYESSGGGIACYLASPTISNCTISGNSAGYGGGVYFDTCSATIANCSIRGNSARANGGSIYCNYGDPTITNCTIRGNSAEGNGGSIYCYHADPTITNCTIIGNSVDDDDGASVRCYDANPTITNCILWDNTPREILGGGGPDVTYCDVQGGWSGTGNIDIAPVFAFEDDLHLMAGSPCIDTGTSSPPGGLPAVDRDGNPRSLDGDGDSSAVADMGIYEFTLEEPSIALSPTDLTFYAVAGGLNPEDEAFSIRNCGGTPLNWQVLEECYWLSVLPANGQSAGEVDEVTVNIDTNGMALGTYGCVLEVNDPAAVNSPRHVTVTLHLGETLHVPAEYSTIQGAIDAAIDGDVVIVADGTYTGDDNKDLGFDGKAITVRSENGPKTCIIDCQDDGRGFYFHTGEGVDSIVDGFTIRNSGYISLDCSYSSSPTITNCMIFDGHNSGVYCSDSNPTITNCTISGNSADSKGGGVYCHAISSNPTITSCTIMGNTASEEGGGIYTHHAQCHPTITNCILWGNVPREIFVGAGDGPVVTYCDVQAGWVGTGNIDDDPLFVDPLGDDGIPGTVDDDLRLQSGSPCVNTGNNDADTDATTPEVDPLPETDLDGHARVLCDWVDMGAYEFGIGSYDCDLVVDLDDFSSCFSCITGPEGEPYTEGCEACDFDFDLDVDLFDLAGFQTAFTVE